jgi:deoxyadenosine/deoxycytidine kinase
VKGSRKRIEIAGGIASGKTTLARLLKRIGLTPVHERFRKNPFYLAFYEDPVGAALETEITFLLQHYHEQKLAASSTRSFCADFSIALDQAYAAVTLPREDQRLFEVIRKRVEQTLPRRSLLIHLACSPEIELRRIRRRNRTAERSITLEYLRQVDEALRRRVAALSRSEHTLTIDSGVIDFAFKQRCRTNVLRTIKQALTSQ